FRIHAGPAWSLYDRSQVLYARRPRCAELSRQGTLARRFLERARGGASRFSAGLRHSRSLRDTDRRPLPRRGARREGRQEPSPRLRLVYDLRASRGASRLYRSLSHSDRGLLGPEDILGPSHGPALGLRGEIRLRLRLVRRLDHRVPRYSP